MANFFNDIAGGAEKMQAQFLGPTYNYAKNIKAPVEMKMSGEGNMTALGNDINGIIAYTQLLVEGKGNANKKGTPLGNKFYLKTGGQCTSSDGNKHDRYIYVNNVPTGSLPIISDATGQAFGDFRGLIPGTIGNVGEINPLAITDNDELIVIDSKISLDDNSKFRLQDISNIYDWSQVDKKEAEASLNGLSYIALEGNIGCMVIGAGLAMATMDLIKLSGGLPANFLDVGGGATSETVSKAFKILLSDKNVLVVLVNIFGGIMRCDIIAEGIISAAKEVGVTIPIVVRLEGTNVELGKEILRKSSLNIISVDNLTEAAKKSVELTTLEK